MCGSVLLAAKRRAPAPRVRTQAHSVKESPAVSSESSLELQELLERLLCLLVLVRVKGKVKLEAKDFLRVSAISDFFMPLGLPTHRCIALLEAAACDASKYFDILYEDAVMTQEVPKRKRRASRFQLPWRPPVPGEVLQCRVLSVEDEYAILQLKSPLYEGRLNRRWWRSVPKAGRLSPPVRVLSVRKQEMQVELRHLWPEEPRSFLQDFWGLTWDEPLPSRCRYVMQREAFGTCRGLEAVTLAREKRPVALVLPRDKPQMVGSFVAVEGRLWPVLQRNFTNGWGYTFPGAVRVGRIQSLVNNGIWVDVAEASLAFVLNKDLLRPRSSYFCGRAIVLRVYDEDRTFFRARQIHPKLETDQAAGAKEVPATKKEVPKENFLALPRLGSVVLGTRSEASKEVQLQHPPCRAMLKEGEAPEAWTVYRVCDVACDSQSLAVPVVVEAEKWVTPKRWTLPKIGSKVLGTVKGYAQQQLLADGSVSDGLLVFCTPGKLVGFCPVPSLEEAQKRVALGTQLGSVMVLDYMTLEGNPGLLLAKNLGSGRVRVGDFYEGQLEERKGSMWKMKLGDTRALVTAAKLNQPQAGQKLWVRVLARDLKPPGVAFVRSLNWEEKEKQPEELEKEVKQQAPMPRVGILVRGRWLGPSFKAVDAETKVDPRMLKAVAQRVGEDDVIVELEELPCLGVLFADYIIACKEMDPALLEGQVTTFPTSNILGTGIGTFVELRMPTIPLQQLRKGDRLEGSLHRLRDAKGRAKLGDEWVVHLNCEHRRQPVEGHWTLETPADLRCSRVLGPGSRICNLKVLKIDRSKCVVQLSPTAREVEELRDTEVLQGIVGRIMEYGIFFEVGCRARVLCRSVHLLRPVDEYSEGQVVPRLFVFQTSKMTRPQLCEGGPPAKLQRFEDGAMEAFGLDEEVSITGQVVSILPYGLLIELQDMESRDAFCKEEKLLKSLEAYAVGDQLTCQVLTVSFMGDIEVQEVA